MRVTGDCLRDARAFVFAADFFIGLVDFFAALFRLAAGLDALFDAAFDALFALLLPRDAARFDAVDDLRRAFPPDDFDADAMINSSRKVRYNIAQDSRAMSSCGKALQGRQRRFCSRRCKNADTNNRLQDHPAQRLRGERRKREGVCRLGGQCAAGEYPSSFRHCFGQSSHREHQLLLAPEKSKNRLTWPNRGIFLG
jgi:endogenous inhibitor of DNA gyrase (YacG/DUF329 family)